LQKDHVDIISVFAIGCELEYQVELARQRLVQQCPDFNTIDAFRYLDKEGQGYIVPHDLLVALRKQIGIDYAELEDDVIMIFQKFDKDESRQMKYSEFCDAFAPKEPQALKELAGRVPMNVNLTMNYKDMFSQQTRQMYKDCWMQHFSCEKETEILRQRLLQNPFFDLQKAFKIFDIQNKSFITKDDVTL
jgi:Ca2+-binding EF-hand superfamily protein